MNQTSDETKFSWLGEICLQETYRMQRGLVWGLCAGDISCRVDLLWDEDENNT